MADTKPDVGPFHATAAAFSLHILMNRDFRG
jgi:hypothetical protein